MSQRTAIVTGGGSGIGQSIARRLAKDGFWVAVADIDRAAAEAAASDIGRGKTGVRAYTVDVSSRPDVHRCVSEVKAQWGGIHVLVNNAAVVSSSPFEEITDEEWDHVLAVNLKGSFLFAQAVVPIMREQGCGRIVNISSLAGQGGALAPSLPYAVSKAGQINLTRVLARMVARDGITVNAVAPTATASPQMERIGSEGMKRMSEAIPVGRLARMEEIAAAVSFLCGDEAGFITGATLDLNGGLFTR